MKIQPLNVTNPVNKKSKPNFSGHVLTKDVYGNDIYKFFTPNAIPGVQLEYVIMTHDKDGNYSINKDAEHTKKTVNLPQGFDSLVLYADDLNLTKDSVLGYKIIYPNKFFKDNSMTGDGGYTIATPLNRTNPSRPKVMEHVFVDSFNIKNQKGLHTKRNHFNVLGGNINSVNERIPELAKVGFTDVLGNPVTGQDNKSSQGYWTTNPYQVTNNLGDIKDLKKLMLNMFRNDMRWTMDGAFVNEGVEGIHIKDIMNWQYESPFVHFFETKDLNNIAPRFGVLSKNPAVNEHTHIQIVNGPYKIVFEKSGDKYIEKEIKRSPVDPTKPTYIQLFDDRLASEMQMSGNFIFDVYDNKDTGDNHEIANYRDSVQAYHARVTPREVADNYAKYKEAKRYNKDLEFKNSLTRWKGFEVVESNKDGGISLWVGNSDISKKRFIMPESSLYEQNLPEDLKSIVKAAPYQVQDDTVQIGKFWTGEISKLLTEYTAREIGDKVADGMTYKQAIEALITEKRLPEGAKKVLEEEDGVSPLQNILTDDIFGEGKNYQLKPVRIPETIEDGVMSYPLEAIEFSPDLVSVFAYPYIKNLAVTEDTVGKSRFEMYQMGDNYYNKIPEKYRDTYKEADQMFAQDYTQEAIKILKRLENKFNAEASRESENKPEKKFLDENNKLTEEGKKVYSLIASDIVKFLTISALAPEIEPQYQDNMLSYDTKELNKVDLNSLNLQYETSPEATAQYLMQKIKSGIKNIPNDKKELFLNSLSERLAHIDNKSFDVARLVIEKTEAGLNWRIDASKDVGYVDYDDAEDGTLSKKDNEREIEKFWNKFNTGVNEYNPNSFKIGELTDLGAGVLSGFTSRTKFDATSDYDFFYSTLFRFFGRGDYSDDSHLDDLAGEMEKKLFTHVYPKNTELGYFDTGTLDTINYAHRFVGNHDKPRILHLLATDASKLKSDRSAEAEYTLEYRGMRRSNEFKHLPANHQEALIQANHGLRNGIYHVDGKEKHFDPEKYGSRPFDINIDDIVREAAEINADFKNFVNDKNNEETINKLKADILFRILENPLKKQRAIWFMMNALPGTPTNYAGDELGMTGWEYEAKNEEQENRNALRWDRLNNPNYAFLKTYKKNIDDITKIRKKDGASALVNGSTIKLEDQPLDNNHKALTLYRYNDKTDAICILHNTGFGPLPEDCPVGEMFIDRIGLQGLPNGLAQGTIYVDALKPYDKYKVTNQFEIKKVNNNNTEQIEGNINIGNAGLILLRESDFKGNKFSFKGRMENPNVKLANMKYNFSYMQR